MFHNIQIQWQFPSKKNKQSLNNAHKRIDIRSCEDYNEGVLFSRRRLTEQDTLIKNLLRSDDEIAKKLNESPAREIEFNDYIEVLLKTQV